MNAKDLLQQTDECLKELIKIQSKLKDIELNTERLLQSDVLPIGTRVRLKKNYNTNEYIAKWPGWRAYLHFMNPNNPATIEDIEVCCQKIFYLIKFDNQTRQYQILGETHEYKMSCNWQFPQNAIEIIK